MPFDKTKFVEHLRANALPGFGAGKCAKYVREGLVAGGLVTTGNPFSAKDYGPFLVRLGFKSVATAMPYTPQTGDVVVMPATSASIHGHIAAYDGRVWISDFVQTDMFGGPSYRQGSRL